MLVISPVNYLASAGKIVNVMFIAQGSVRPLDIMPLSMALREYGKQLTHNVPESTCRKFRDEYRKEFFKKRAECSTWRDDTSNY